MNNYDHLQPISNVQRIFSFSKEEKLRLNFKKKKEMVIDLCNKKSEIPMITIDNTAIERTIHHISFWVFGLSRISSGITIPVRS